MGGRMVGGGGFEALLGMDVALLGLVILALSVGYKDDYKGTDRGSLTRMAWDSIGIIVRSPRLRTLFPALFLLFAGWMLAFTYIHLVIERLYHGDKVSLGRTPGRAAGAAGRTAPISRAAVGAPAAGFGHWRSLYDAPGVGLAPWQWRMFALALGTPRAVRGD